MTVKLGMADVVILTQLASLEKVLIKAYGKICRSYYETISPGIDATDRAFTRSKATSSTRFYK